jgi:hypothetical protein
MAGRRASAPRPGGGIVARGEFAPERSPRNGHDDRGPRRDNAAGVATAGSRRLDAGTVMAVQRAAGNRAVVALLKRHGANRKRAGTGPAAPVRVSRRRIPAPDAGGALTGGLTSILTDYEFEPGSLLATKPVDAANLDAHLKGLTTLITRAAAELSPPQKAQVQTLACNGLSLDDFRGLPQKEQLLRASGAVLQVAPGLQLGDPFLIDTGARPGSPDAGNIATLVGRADAIFNQVAGGTCDASLAEVFGAANVIEAKKRYAKGRKWLQKLHVANRIVADRSGYHGEAHIGGLTGLKTQISLSPGMIDKPNDIESIVTLVHESMHAGNADVVDQGYIHQPNFTQLSEPVKLGNAAHYEVAARRVLGAAFSYLGLTFVEAPAVGSGAVGAVTEFDQSVREASETFRKAWTIAINLHNLFVNAHKAPWSWTTDLGAGLTYQNALPYWSKVEALTIHEKAVIDPSGPASKQPVSQIDVALSEGVVHRLAIAMDSVPRTEEQFTLVRQAAGIAGVDHVRLLLAATPQERATGVANLMIRAVLVGYRISPITGDIERDMRVVAHLAASPMSRAYWLTARDPATFA